MKIHSSPNLKIHRDKNGVPHICGETLEDLYWGLGYCHGTDRALSLLLVRILAQGRAAELLDPSDEMVEVDRFFRRMNWRKAAEREVEKLDSKSLALTLIYCEGINSALQKKIPWEFKLLRYRPEPWKVEDTLLLSPIMGYINLAQSQGEIERFFLQMVQAGVDQKKIEEFFSLDLKGVDLDLLKKIKLSHPVIPAAVPWKKILPPLTGSNNWVISGQKSASGKAMLSNDPHLETNRLPNVWYEAVLKKNDGYAMGATVPGLPTVLLGRTDHLAWGATYTFMDGVDSWIEKCKDGHYWEEEEWKPFIERKEIIKRQKNSPLEVTFFETPRGTIEGDPQEEGYYLSTAWASSQAGAKSLNQMFRLWDVRTVEEGMEMLGRVETAWNWVLADSQGNTGYQMSGLMPKRKEGHRGFLPIEGWKKENQWQGFVDWKDLPRCLNPEDGYFVTANQNLNGYGKAHPINICQGDHRSREIGRLLSEGKSMTPEDFGKIHHHLRSPQAEKFMEILRPLLPSTHQGELLKKWDLTYSVDSLGAYLFEKFYRALILEVFGKKNLGEEVLHYLLDESALLADFYCNFDSVLLSENSSWWEGENRDEVYEKVAKEALSVEPRPWGEVNQITFSHILLGGKLPKFLGFDKGPFPLPGGRATPHQTQLFKSGGRSSSFAPSYRFIVDFAKEGILSNLAGGPSDRRFSKWYASDLKNWMEGKYKSIKNE